MRSFSYWKHFLLGTFWMLSSQNKPFDHAKLSTKVVCYLCIIGLLFLGWKPCLFKCLRQYLSFKVTGANVLYLNTCQTNFLVLLLSECILRTVQQGATLVTKKSSYFCSNIYINWEVNLASCHTQAFGLCNSKRNDSHYTHSFKRRKIMKTR